MSTRPQTNYKKENPYWYKVLQEEEEVPHPEVQLDTEVVHSIRKKVLQQF